MKSNRQIDELFRKDFIKVLHNVTNEAFWIRKLNSKPTATNSVLGTIIRNLDFFAIDKFLSASVPFARESRLIYSI